MTSSMSTFERVREAVARDLRPVRPILSPSRRLLLLVPIAVVVAAVATVQYERDDFEALGVVLTWGLSALQWVLGILVLGIALRQAVPGYGLSGRTRWLTCVGVLIFMTGVTLATHRAHPTFVPPGRTWVVWYLCFTGAMKSGLPLLIVTCLLAARAFPTNPAAVGALCGLATGVVTDSGWRLTCWISAPTHVLGAHAFAIAAMVACGAFFTLLLDRRRWQERSGIYRSA